MPSMSIALAMSHKTKKQIAREVIVIKEQDKLSKEKKTNIFIFRRKYAESNSIQRNKS